LAFVTAVCLQRVLGGQYECSLLRVKTVLVVLSVWCKQSGCNGKQHTVQYSGVFVGLCIDTDAPRLCDINVESDDDFASLVKSFVCQSLPVAAKARLDHATEMRLLEQPYWHTLGTDTVNYIDTDDEEHISNWKIF